MMIFHKLTTKYVLNQTFAEKYANKPDILAKLNEESKQLQVRYDKFKLKTRREGLQSQLEQARKTA